MTVQPKEESKSMDDAFMFRTVVQGLGVIYKSQVTMTKRYVGAFLSNRKIEIKCHCYSGN